MDHDVESPGGTPSVEELQDFYLNSESKAAIARGHLEDMIEFQKKQAATVVNVIHSLREGLRNSEKSRLLLDDENRRQAAQIVELERQLKHVHANFARLSTVYSAMMRVVEDTHANSVGLHQRIDAMLLPNELSIDHPVPTPSRRATEFRESVFPQSHLNRPHREPHMPRLNDGHHSALHHTAYEHEGYSSLSMPAHR